jgi:FemAB-related protein (PEP-CTERM system-associated)
MAVEALGFSRADEELWDAYVGRSGCAGHSHRVGWRRVIQRSYGHHSVYLWAREGDTVTGIMPLIIFRDLRGTRSLVSMPFLDDGGVCAERVEDALALVERAMEVLRTTGAVLLDLRHREPSGLALPRHGSKVTLTLKLAHDSDAMWRGFDAKLRNQIRKAQKSGLTVSWAGIEGLDDFYDAFAENMRDLGSPVHGQRFFRTVLEEFGEGARLAVIRHGAQAVGGGVCLTFRDTLLMPWASSVRRYRWACPNSILYWEALRWGCEKGLRLFDFGRSSPGSGTYRFKKQWGAVEEPLHWQRVVGEERSAGPEETETPWARLAAGTWKRLPLRVATTVGPMLRGRISK